MNTVAELNRITKDVEGLDYNSKINLMARIVSMLKWAPVSVNSHKITDLRGLGKDIWKNVDIEEYIKNERKSWN